MIGPSRLLALALLLPATQASAALNSTFQQTGNLGIEIVAAAGGNTPITSGTLMVNSIPIGAIIVRATLHASEVNNPFGLNATFNGTSVSPTGSPVSDGAFITMYEYCWDVKPLITAGPGSYNFHVGQAVPASNQIAVVALVVVWQAPTEPNRTIAILDGMKQVGESGAETESATFNSLPAGPTTAWVVTSGDDNGATGETVAYNGTNIGGPLDGGLGMSASLLQMSTTSQSGSNTMAITTGLDHMGWMIAAVSVTPSATPTSGTSWGRIKSLYR